MTETTPRREATRLRLIQAGIETFAAKGIDATSVEHLCDAANFSRGAFYSNFSSKDELCLAIFRYIGEQHMERIAAAAASLPQTADLNEILDHLAGARYRDKNMSLVELELELRAQRDPEFDEALGETATLLRPMFTKLLTQAAQQLKIDILVDPFDLLQIFDALFAFSAYPRTENHQRSTRLMTLVARHMTRPAAS